MGTDLEPIDAGTVAEVSEGYLDDAQMAVLRKTLAPAGTSDAELALFVSTARTLGLNPFAGQIQAIKFESSGPVVAYRTWEGLLALAERTGEYQGHDGPFWSADGVDWREVWLEDEEPKAAKVIVYRRGHRPTTGIALMSESRRLKFDGKPMALWARGKMPIHMLGKQALRVALKRAFPFEVDQPITPAQLKALHTLAASQGFRGRADRMEASSAIIGRTITSFRELSKGEAGELIDTWAESEPPTADEVMEELAAAHDAVADVADEGEGLGPVDEAPIAEIAASPAATVAGQVEQEAIAGDAQGRSHEAEPCPAAPLPSLWGTDEPVAEQVGAVERKVSGGRSLGEVRPPAGERPAEPEAVSSPLDKLLAVVERWKPGKAKDAWLGSWNRMPGFDGLSGLEMCDEDQATALLAMLAVQGHK